MHRPHMKSAPQLSSASPKTPSPIKNPGKLREKQQKDNTSESREDRLALQHIDQAIARCRELLQTPLFNERTRREYEKMLRELRQDREVEKVDGNIGYLMQAKNDAESYKNSFFEQLNEAVAKEWISSESRTRWESRFNDPNVLEWTRKEWILNEFPKMMKGWKETAEKRAEVEKLAKTHGLTAKQIPELADILNVKGLLSHHYLSRKNKIDKAMALILAYNKEKTGFLRYIEKELEDAADAGWIHRSKVGEWMERVMKNGNPEAFASKILFPFIKNWKETKDEFDRLNLALDRQGVPRGFRPVKEHDFLLMKYKQRTSYCVLAWIRLENAPESEKALASARLRIRHNLDTKDWEGAEEDLTAALKQWPDNRELLSMQTFLRQHRPEEESVEKETPDPQVLLSSLRGMLSLINGELHPMYVQAAMAGPKVFNRFLQINYNRVWVHEHSYLDPSREIENAQDEFNHAMTEQYMRHGHSKTIEHNIVDGKTAAKEAIRYEGRKPQMLYMGKLGQSAVMQAVKDNADNDGFGHGTSIIPKETPYAVHARIVKNLHYPMKTALRQLDRMGYRFTAAGSPQRKGGMSAPADANQYAMAS